MANADQLVQDFFTNYAANLSKPMPGNWREVANDLIDHLVANGECFSSGEIARWLRIHRDDLWFSVPNLGEHVRDLFYASGMASYPDDGFGNPVYPCQVPRTTQGLGRTPSGLQVFVYAVDQTAGFAHNFEVDIPKPGDAATSYPDDATVAAASAKQPQPKAQVGVTIQGSSKPLVAMKATVQKDRRLQVPRSCFEAYVHFCGATLRGGDPVFVKVEADKATITVSDPGNGAKEHNLWATSGRVSFTSPGTPFNPGDVFLVNIAPNGLTIDLTQVVKSSAA
jgi:hypothetical protein